MPAAAPDPTRPRALPAGRLSPRRGWAAGVGASLALATLVMAEGSALAQPSRGVSLRWDAPEGCPAAAEVLAKVDQLLEGRPTGPAREIEVRGRVAEEAGGGWRVRLELGSRGEGDGGTRVREVRGASCAALGSATAVILALMIDPLAMAARGAQTDEVAGPAPPVGGSAPSIEGAPGGAGGAGSPGGDPAAAPTDAAPGAGSSGLTPAAPAGPAGPDGSAGPAAPAGSTAPALPQPPSPAEPAGNPAARGGKGSGADLSFRVNGWIGMDVGALPDATPGLGLFGAVHAGRQRFELGFAVWPARATALPGTASGMLRVGLTTGTASTCRLLLTGRVELAPCAGLEIGGAYAETFGVPVSGDASTLWAALRAGGTVAWMPEDGAGLVARLELVVPVAGPTFTLQGVGPVHEAAPIGGRGSVGVEVRF